MDLEQARLTVKTLEDLKLHTEIRHLKRGLFVVQPSTKMTMIRAAGLKVRLTRALRLVEMLEAMLK